MFMRLRAGAAGLLVLAAVFSVLAGCAHRTKGVVKGEVTFFGKKLTAGTVGFEAKDGRMGAGNIDSNGNYTVYDAPVGPCTVTVRVPKVQMMPGMKDYAKPPGHMPPMRPPGGDENVDSSSLVDPSKIVQIPSKYGSAESSGLTFSVEPGEQTYNITLSP